MNTYKTLIVLVATAWICTTAYAGDPAVSSPGSGGVTVSTLSAPTAAVSTNATASAPATTTTTVTTTSAAAPSLDLQKQPTTVVEAAPLTGSAAEELRKTREQTEVETEQKIAEKLEQARMADEKKRQQKILGSMDQQDAPPIVAAPVPPPPAEPAPTPVVITVPSPAPIAPAPAPQAPAPAPATPPPAALAPLPTTNQTTAELQPLPDIKEKPSYFFSGNIGQLNYHTSGITTQGDFALSLGKHYTSNWDVSVDLGYSQSNISQGLFVFQNLNQYDAGLTARYVFWKGMVQPSAGATIDYVRRQYSGLQSPYGTVVAANGGSLGQETSDAIDFGLVAALDVAVSNNMTLGLEYRYMMNLTYSYEGQNVLNSSAYQNQYGSVTPLEGLGYDVWSFVLKYTF